MTGQPPNRERCGSILKRKFGYRTGVVIDRRRDRCDTPPVEGAYVAYRQARLMKSPASSARIRCLADKPDLDVILGGGADPFTAAKGRP